MQQSCEFSQLCFLFLSLPRYVHKANNTECQRKGGEESIYRMVPNGYRIHYRNKDLWIFHAGVFSPSRALTWKLIGHKSENDHKWILRPCTWPEGLVFLVQQVPIAAAEIVLESSHSLSKEVARWPSGWFWLQLSSAPVSMVNSQGEHQVGESCHKLLCAKQSSTRCLEQYTQLSPLQL